MKQLGIFGTSDTKNNSSEQRSYWKLSVDGAARNNPGPAGAGIYLLKNEHVVEAAGYALGIRTNNQAEYLALLIGLLYVRQHRQPNDLLLIISDSQLLIRQMQGVYKVRHANIKPLHAVAKMLLKDMPYDLMHVLREENTNADELANKGIDQRKVLPESLAKELASYGVVL